MAKKSMASLYAQSGRLSWKTILGVIGLIQLIIFAAFQSGFFAISRAPKSTKFKYVPIDTPPRLSQFQDKYWVFEIPEKRPLSRNLSHETDSFDINSETELDVHEESDESGHTFEVSVHSNISPGVPHIIKNSVAIGLAITSRKCKWGSIREIRETFPFFHTLLASFCQTASYNYSYNFFLAFDKTDKFFSDLGNLRKFQAIFYESVRISCHPYSEYMLHFVQCSHNKHPAWAQNDAMLAAYMSNMEYFYRINDDTRMKTKQWTEVFIKTLNNFKPPNVGVVGPTHRGGNVGILTYDFVHHTHIDIHGVYYPHVFSDWHADRWITETYRPGRCVKVKFIHLQHTLEMGQRYSQTRKPKNIVKSVVADSRALVQRYVDCRAEGQTADRRKVVSMSLYGRDPVYTYGAIRNLQLHKCFLSDWSVRVYVLQPFDDLPKHLAVPKPVLDKLIVLGAEVVYLNSSYSNVEPRLWRFLVADDDSVDYFVIHETHGRLNAKYESLTKNWLESSSPFFCCRDKDAQITLAAGLLGAERSMFRTFLEDSVENLIRKRYSKNELSKDGPIFNGSIIALPSREIGNDFIEEVLDPIYRANAKCYDDKRSSSKWSNSQPFPFSINVFSNDTLGAAFNQFELKIKK